MKLKGLIIGCFATVFFAFSLTAQKSTTNGLNKDVIKQIKENVKINSDLKARMNAVAAEEIKDLSLDNANREKVDHYFKYKVKSSGITDQKSSGRCWLFTGLNVLRPKVMEKLNISDFQFSQNYNFFWDQMEKANLFLQAIIDHVDKPMSNRKVEWLFKNAIGDGGQWTGVVNIISKYGVVPADVMPETKSSESTSRLSRLVKYKIREFALELREMHKNGKKPEELSARKVEMLADVYKMLVIALGEPPVEFAWRYKDNDGNISDYKTFTPQSFYKETVGVDLTEYVMFMNDPSREYEKLYEIEYDRHAYDGDNWKYINLASEKIKEFAKKSIMGNEAMYFSCDVGKQLNSKDGYLDVNNYDYESLLDVTFGMNKKERIQTFSSGSSHGMTLVAVDVDKNENPVKWELENSWGPTSGHNGFLTVTDKWFDEYMFRVVIHKKFVTEDVLKILEQEATVLPPWDPMYKQDN